MGGNQAWSKAGTLLMHQALNPQTKFSLGHFKHAAAHLLMIFHLFTIPSSILGLGLLN